VTIRTVGDLADALEDFDRDAPLRVAFQPSWPLRAVVHGVVEVFDGDEEDGDFSDGEDHDGDDDADRGTVWVAVDQVGSDGPGASESPYAPRGAWE